MREGHNLVSHRAIAKLHEECLVSKHLFTMTTQDKCPRCDTMGLKRWEELNDEEREVVKRLPQSADFTLAERKTSHRWCTRCWHEAMATDEMRLT
jgi:hypothetical protein